eukprot:TRINITY_DN26736_c0_g1_i1.p1 TRINITY_DN26736_c0_g1~~TRINITY_DN26736_c0_g1_i1.p1  ORF type:complete len:290 (+),score=78.90 TRINITY_DN26736_c0_g1_i1:76-870(+)
MTPALKESKFLQEGVLTPEEFVRAGDLLVFKCPTWSWAGGLPEKAVPYLPSDKQFLITKKLPCRSRYREEGAEPKKGEMVDDDWLAVTSAIKDGEEVIPDMVEDKKEKKPEVDDDDEDIPDMEEFDVEDNLVENDPAASNTVPNIQSTRTYDISITYDKYYLTPKIWLLGYAENGRLLTPQEIFMDISADHAGKTVTVEPHPHLGTPFAYIHPCKHASVMKKFVGRIMETGRTPEVEFYLLLFLKFIGIVIPTIAYDNTFEYGL